MGYFAADDVVEVEMEVTEFLFFKADRVVFERGVLCTFDIFELVW